MKIGIVGDLHIAPKPDKRIDDYFQVGLNKISEISQYCDSVIFLGDIFTKSSVEDSFVIRLMRHLAMCKNMYNVNFYTIIGNHDVDHEEEDNIVNSSLGILAESQVITLITPDKPIIIDGYRFNTVPVKYKNAVKFLENKHYDNVGATDVLLVHHEYETGTNCFSYNDFKDLGCSLIFLGHDHKPFDEGRIVYPEYSIYRSGSIMRNRADDYNFTRPLYYYVLENGVVSCVGINAVPFDKIFKVEAINKIELQERKYTESIDKIIQKYENNISVQDKFSIKLILQELNAKPENIDYIRKKYESIGEVFV